MSAGRGRWQLERGEKSRDRKSETLLELFGLAIRAKVRDDEEGGVLHLPC